jgi:hypothetical protein
VERSEGQPASLTIDRAGQRAHRPRRRNGGELLRGGGLAPRADVLR